MNQQSQPVIELNNITKEYILHHEKPTLVESFVKGSSERFTALNGISLSVGKGERVGLIGPNGSGKTTLLKIISGISTPTGGTVTVRGKIVSLIDLEAGFHPDLSGYQNIFINGMILGMTMDEIKDKLDDIISFADIGRFIDAPLYTYSSGMQLRLGYAVAIHVNPDILILDESLQVGDKDFQKKCRATLRTFGRKAGTLVVASHNVDFIEMTCTRVIRLKNGSIAEEGDTSMLSRFRD